MSLFHGHIIKQRYAPNHDGDFDLANPPYVPDDEIGSLAVEVRDHEPRSALSGGSDGLDVVRLIAAEARRRLRSDGALFLEIGAGQADEAAAIVAPSGPWESVETHRDLAGRDRFVIARA